MADRPSRLRNQLTSSPAVAPGESLRNDYQLIPVEPASRAPISLQRPVLLIGRHPECDVRIDLPKISVATAAWPWLTIAY